VNLIARHQEELLPEMKQVTLLKSDKEILEQRCKGLKAELKKKLQIKLQKVLVAPPCSATYFNKNLRS
jgi:hypothetical protein